jgi:hypothetical protein
MLQSAGTNFSELCSLGLVPGETVDIPPDAFFYELRAKLFLLNGGREQERRWKSHIYSREWEGPVI